MFDSLKDNKPVESQYMYSMTGLSILSSLDLIVETFHYNPRIKDIRLQNGELMNWEPQTK